MKKICNVLPSKDCFKADIFDNWVLGSRIFKAAPSLIVSTIQDTGRDAILRGSGGSNSAAVCILETHAPNISDPVRGLVRMVQVSPSVIILDITVRGFAQGKYNVTIRERGDISRGAASTGGVWEGSRGTLGKLEVDSAGVSGVLVDKEIAIWELIGRSIVVSREISPRDGEFEEAAANDEYTLVGVIARSAGVWENDKTVSLQTHLANSPRSLQFHLFFCFFPHIWGIWNIISRAFWQSISSMPARTSTLHIPSGKKKGGGG